MLKTLAAPFTIFLEEDGGEGQGGGSGEESGHSSSDDWKSSIQDESLRGNPALKDIPDVTTLARNHIELQQHLGTSLRIPGPDAGKEDWKAFTEKLVEKVPTLIPAPESDNPDSVEAIYRRLGAPDSADKYKDPDLDSKGLELSTDTLSLFREIAHENRLTQKQYEGIVKKVTERNVDTALDMQKQHETAIKGLKSEWGADYDNRMEEASNFAEQSGAPPSLIRSLSANQVHPGHPLRSDCHRRRLPRPAGYPARASFSCRTSPRARVPRLT